MRLPTGVRAGFVLVACATAGCHFWDPLDQPGLRVALLVSDTGLYVGDSFAARAAMVNTYGDTYPSQDIHFGGLDPEISVTPNGTVTGIAYGTGRILAFREHLIDTALVTVVPAGTIALSSYSTLDVRGVDGSSRSSVASVGQGVGDAAAWVPDRDSLVYSFGIPGGAGAADLYVTDLTGLHQLITRGGLDPSVSRDGIWVYFTSVSLTTTMIERVDLDGTGRELVVPGRVLHPDPSPNGAELAFIHEPAPPRSGFDIKIRTLADSTERVLTTDGIRPRWSPDGDSIAFLRRDPNSVMGAIYLVSADGSGLRQVSLPGRLYSPNVLDWSPDGQWLVARGAQTIELIQVATGLALPLGYFVNYQTAAWR